MSTPKPSNYKAVRGMTLFGVHYAPGTPIPNDVAGKLKRLREWVEIGRIVALNPDELPPLVTRTPVRELLPLDTAAERNLARADLARYRAKIEADEAVGLRPNLYDQNAVLAYESMFADVARANRNVETGKPWTVAELEEHDERSLRGDDKAVLDDEELLDEGTIPTAEDGNEDAPPPVVDPDLEGASAVIPEPPPAPVPEDVPGKGPPGPQDAPAPVTPPNPPPVTPSAPQARGGRHGKNR